LFEYKSTEYQSTEEINAVLLEWFYFLSLICERVCLQLESSFDL